MVIIEDTRNNADSWEFVRKGLEAKGIKVVRSKLLCGDYALANNQSISVDTKKDVMELAMDMHQDHERFRREADLAVESGIKLYILILDEYIYNLDGVKYFKIPTYKGNQYKVINGVRFLTHKRGEKRANFNLETLTKALKTFEERHGVKFVFCKRAECVDKILELLTKGA
jgi:hypothetical protein